MKIRTLISNQLYFGLEPLDLRRGTERTLSRVFGLPPDRVRVTRETLREDFRLDTAESETLLRAFVGDGLLQADPATAGTSSRKRGSWRRWSVRRRRSSSTKRVGLRHRSMPTGPGIR